MLKNTRLLRINVPWDVICNKQIIIQNSQHIYVPNAFGKRNNGIILWKYHNWYG